MKHNCCFHIIPDLFFQIIELRTYFSQWSQIAAGKEGVGDTEKMQSM